MIHYSFELPICRRLLTTASKALIIYAVVFLCQQFTPAQTAIKAKLDNPKEYLRRVAGLTKQRRLVNRDFQDEPKAGLKSGDLGFAESPHLNRRRDFEKAGSGPSLSAVEQPTVLNFPLFDTTNLNGVDPMIAVGEKFVVVSDGTWLKFFHKHNGKGVEIVNPKDSSRTVSIATFDFFSIWLRPQLPNSQGQLVDNPDVIENDYDHIPSNIPAYCSKVTDNPHYRFDGVVNEPYDVRVAYQRDHKRFVVLTAVRNRCTQTNKLADTAAKDQECKSLCVRLVAWAVSLTEDPRDGFHFYRNNDNNYRDWPRFIVDKDFLTIAHNGPGDDGSTMVSVYSMPDMLAGNQQLRSFRILRQDVLSEQPSIPLPRAVMPILNHHDDVNEPFVYFAERINGASGLRFWYFKKPAHPQDIFTSPPQFLEAAGHINPTGGRFDDPLSGIVFSRSNFYIVTNSVSRRAGGDDTRITAFGLNFFRIPVKAGPFRRDISDSPADGYRHFFLDDENYSYEFPALAVNSRQHVLLSFLRLPVRKNSAERSQIRGKLFRHDENDFRRSILLKESAVSGSRGALADLDYSWAVADPHGTGYWVSHSYRPTSNGLAMYMKNVLVSDLK